MKFQVGDKVKVVADDCSQSGSIGEVVGTQAQSDVTYENYAIKVGNGIFSGFFPEELKLIRRPQRWDEERI